MISRSYKYILDGTNVIYEKQQTVAQFGGDTNELYYHYDESGISGFELNGVTYYYLKNIQGDVINILNSSGQVVVTYTYDAWGKVLSVTGSLASTVGQINPFRYRGYYYDTETGFYYLQTRYYDPEVGRFLNADGYVSTGQGIIGNNMFAYCSNSPVIHSDPTGCVIRISEYAANDDLEQFEDAWNYLCRSLTARIFLNIFILLPIEFNLVFAHNVGSSYEPETKTIYWDPYCGVVTGNGTSVQSPAIGLLHEMGHAVQDINGMYDGVDLRIYKNRLRLENDVINRFEGPICDALGEPKRVTYDDSSGTRVMDSSTHYRITYRKWDPGFWFWQWLRFKTIVEDRYGR